MIVECDQCQNFIKPIIKDNTIFSKVLLNAKCKLGKRVLFQKPKTNFDCGGYFRNCIEFNSN